MNDENVERIAVFRLGGGNETPIVGICQSGKQRLRQRERAQLRIELQLDPAAPRRFDHRIHMVLVGPGRQFEIIGHRTREALIDPPYPGCRRHLSRRTPLNSSSPSDP